MESKFPAGTVAVIFMAKSSGVNPEGYAAAATAMRAEAERQPGYVGFWGVHGEDGVGIAVSYWESDDAARGWKAHAGHAATREQGRAQWYDWYELVVAQVTRGYGWKKEA